MFIIKPYIFNQFPQITAAVSTIIGVGHEAPFYFNLSFNVKDDEERVLENRKLFFEKLGFEENEIAFQNQIHSDIINVVDSAGNSGEGDAMITSKKNLLLVLTIADCTPVMIYDSGNQVIAAVHSGWRGANKKILENTLRLMRNEFNTKGADLMVYLGPSISQINYQVGEEVASLFDQKYILKSNGQKFLDVASVNYDMLIDFGVKRNNIQRSLLCTYQMKDLFHSYRRDGNKSGRSLAVIGIK
jgi:polyphenol oxidase